MKRISHQRFFFSSSKTIKLSRELGYDQRQLYSLVSDISKYNEFIPGIQKSTVTSQLDDAITAELVFGVNQVSQKFMSQVHLKPYSQIMATCKNGHLFNNLFTIWDFIYISNQSTLVKLQIDLQFNNPVIAKVSGVVLDESAAKIMQCFEKRAHQLYGKPKPKEIG